MQASSIKVLLTIALVFFSFSPVWAAPDIQHCLKKKTCDGLMACMSSVFRFSLCSVNGKVENLSEDEYIQIMKPCIEQNVTKQLAKCEQEKTCLTCSK